MSLYGSVPLYRKRSFFFFLIEIERRRVVDAFSLQAWFMDFQSHTVNQSCAGICIHCFSYFNFIYLSYLETAHLPYRAILGGVQI